jgi:hypothetical protein
MKSIHGPIILNHDSDVPCLRLRAAGSGRRNQGRQDPQGGSLRSDGGGRGGEGPHHRRQEAARYSAGAADSEDDRDVDKQEITVKLATGLSY